MQPMILNSSELHCLFGIDEPKQIFGHLFVFVRWACMWVRCLRWEGTWMVMVPPEVMILLALHHGETHCQKVAVKLLSSQTPHSKSSPQPIWKMDHKFLPIFYFFHHIHPKHDKYIHICKIIHQWTQLYGAYMLKYVQRSKYTLFKALFEDQYT